MTIVNSDATIEVLTRRQPHLWTNPAWSNLREARLPQAPTFGQVCEAEQRLTTWAQLLRRLFPELAMTAGQIESPLLEAPSLGRAFLEFPASDARWLIKADHALPVAGSIKARGGIFEVLAHADDLAVRHGLLSPSDERIGLLSPAARELFSTHEVVVGSTGNLGLSIGIMAATLGFRAVVHMSHDAKAWKKERLRACGATVIEHRGDYGAAVHAGREAARANPHAYFVDDESSTALLLGYAVAALRLQRQLAERRIPVDAKHPLVVYVPCGVGGAPGGITFGLRNVFGDHVHCFFAEPVASPCMLLRLAIDPERPVSVHEIGLDNHTAADGLAVAKASELVASLIRYLVSGIFTVPDEELFRNLYLLEQNEGLRIEPSAGAAFRGPHWLLETPVGRKYMSDHDFPPSGGDVTHIVWTTGGALVPQREYREYHERGRRAMR